MSFFSGLRILGAIAFLSFALPAVAQFEVSPDHYDAGDQKTLATAHKASVHRSSATLATPGTGVRSQQSRAAAAKRKSGSSGASHPAISTGVSSKPKPKAQVATAGSWARKSD